jgi:hypothetical protein
LVYLKLLQMLERRLIPNPGTDSLLSNYSRDAGMVILPAYYAASLNSDMDQVIQYYVDICEASPV